MNTYLNLGARGHDLTGNTPQSLASTLGRIGATHVQLALQKSFPDITTSAAALTPALGHSIRRELEKNNCRVSVLGCYIDPTHPDAKIRQKNLDWFKANLRFANYVGADMVGTETGMFPTLEESHSEEKFQILLDSVRQMTDFAEKVGTIVAIEPVWSGVLYSPQRAKTMLEEINSPNLRLIYDPVNLSNSDDPIKQRELMDEMYRLCGDAIILLHLKDMVMKDGLRFRLAGEGVLDYDYLFDLVCKYTPYIDGILEEANDQQFPIVAKRVRSLWDAAVARA